MADVALVIEENGTIRKVFAGRLKQEDYEKDFFCAGIIEEDGTICGVRMSVIRATEKRKEHFRRYSDAHPHKNGCLFCEKREKITVEMLDRTGKGKTTQDIYDRLNKDKKKRRKPPKVDKINPEEEIETDVVDKEYEEEDREVRSKTRSPQTLPELVMVLQSLDKEEKYADRLVFDQILDERTIAAYRRGSLPLGKPFIITVRKTLSYRYVQNLNNNQWVLVDYWAKDAYTPFVFVLTVTETAKRKLYNLCRLDPAAKIQIYAILKKHPTISSTYVSELVKAHMICASFDERVD